MELSKKDKVNSTAWLDATDTLIPKLYVSLPELTYIGYRGLVPWLWNSFQCSPHDIVPLTTNVEGYPLVDGPRPSDDKGLRRLHLRKGQRGWGHRPDEQKKPFAKSKKSFQILCYDTLRNVARSLFLSAEFCHLHQSSGRADPQDPHC